MYKNNKRNLKVKKINKYRDGNLQVFKKTYCSFTGRIYLGTNDKKQPIYKTKSIKTDDFEYAVRKLKKWCDEYNVFKEKGMLDQFDFDLIKLINDYIKQINAKDLTYVNDGYHSRNVIGWINKNKIKKFTYANFHQLKKYLESEIKTPSGQIGYATNTVTHHFNFIRRMFRYHKQKGTITKNEIPEYPKLKKVAGKRTFFSFDEYRKLINHSITRMNEKGLGRKVELIRKMINRYIIIMCGCGLRVDEMYSLKWKDVHFRMNRKTRTSFCTLDVINGKTGNREVTTKPSVPPAFKELKQVYLEYSDLIKFGKDDKIFPMRFHSSFRNLLKSCDLYLDTQNDKKRDAKSLRQTYISWGLIKGEKIFDIAKNCGNGVAVIEKHYANNITSKDLEDRLSSLEIIK